MPSALLSAFQVKIANTSTINVENNATSTNNSTTAPIEEKRISGNKNTEHRRRSKRLEIGNTITENYKVLPALTNSISTKIKTLANNSNLNKECNSLITTNQHNFVYLDSNSILDISDNNNDMSAKQAVLPSKNGAIISKIIYEEN